MERSLQRVLIAFTVGFLAIGAILGFVGVADCGSVFAPKDGCASALSVQRSLVIVFIGLGLTAMAGAIVADKPEPPAPSDPVAADPTPTVEDD